MFELFDAYRHVVHLAEWTGFSLGALAACGAGLYFGMEIPAVRRLAIGGALLVGGGYVGLMHGAAVTRVDDKAEWAAEKAKMAAAAVTRDQSAAAATAATYDPIGALLKGEELSRNHLVNSYVPPPGACRIGPDALRLRDRPTRK